MFSIEYKVNGKRVRQGGLAKAIDNAVSQAILENVKSQVDEIVKDMKCDEHASNNLKLTLSLNKDEVKIDIDGCCDKFAKEIRKAISE